MQENLLSYKWPTDAQRQHQYQNLELKQWIEWPGQSHPGIFIGVTIAQDSGAARPMAVFKKDAKRTDSYVS